MRTPHVTHLLILALVLVATSAVSAQELTKDGWDVERATAEAEAIGLRSPVLKEFALDFVR